MTPADALRSLLEAMQAIAIQQEVGERYQLAGTMVHLAETLTAAGRHADAQGSLEDALVVCEELNHADTARISVLLQRCEVSLTNRTATPSSG